MQTNYVLLSNEIQACVDGQPSAKAICLTDVRTITSGKYRLLESIFLRGVSSNYEFLADGAANNEIPDIAP